MTRTVQQIIVQFETFSPSHTLVDNVHPVASLSVKKLIHLFESLPDRQDHHAKQVDEISSNRFEKTTSMMVENSLLEISSEDLIDTVIRTEFDLADLMGQQSGNEIAIHPNIVQQRIIAYESIACGKIATVNEIQTSAEKENRHGAKHFRYADVHLSNKLFEETGFPVEEVSLPEIFSEDGNMTVNRTAKPDFTPVVEYESGSDLEILPNVDQTSPRQKDNDDSTENTFICHINTKVSGESQARNSKLKKMKSRLRSMVSQGRRRYKQRTEKKETEKSAKHKSVSLHEDLVVEGKNENGANSVKPRKRMGALYSLFSSCLGYRKRNRKASSTVKCRQSTADTGVPTLRISVSTLKFG